MIHSYFRRSTSRGLLIAVALLAFSLVAFAAEVRVITSYEGDLKFPTDLAADDAGNAYVVDGINKRVVVISKNGDLVREIKSKTFGSILGIDLSDNRIYLSDTENDCIHILSLNGVIQAQVKLPAIVDPVDVAYRDGKLLISDNDNHRLLQFNMDGDLVKVVGRGDRKISVPQKAGNINLSQGSPGELVNEFHYPGLISKTEKGYIVVDVLGARVKAYTGLLNYEKFVGSFGLNHDKLYRPKGAAICDKFDKILVSDSYSGQLKLFDYEKETAVVLQKNGEVWKLSGPTSIVCLGDSWWVVDCRASRIVRFEIK
jgi:hypothetical protein